MNGCCMKFSRVLQKNQMSVWLSDGRAVLAIVSGERQRKAKLDMAIGVDFRAVASSYDTS
jgi:hypothetical protein